MTGINLFDSFRKQLDRASFEADKMLRANRVRSESARLASQAREQVGTLGERVMALYQGGTLREPELLALAREIVDLQARAQQKEDEANAVQAEVWVEPPDTSSPAPRPAGGGGGYGGVPPAPAQPTYMPPATAPQPPPPVRLDDQETKRVPAPAQRDFCANCGAPLRRNAAFCAQCGVRV